MEYTFTWFIENYSFCLQKTEQVLESPEFFVTELENTAWRIKLYPRGCHFRHRKHISIFLVRSKCDDGPEIISLRSKLLFLRVDGSDEMDESDGTELTFRKDGSCGYFRYMNTEDLLLNHKDTFLPSDTLRIRCRMLNSNGNIHKVGQSFARTRIGVEHVSFFHVIKDFSMLEPNKKKTFEFICSEKGKLMKSSIQLADSAFCDMRIILKITPPSAKMVLMKCNLFLLGSSGIVVKCGKEDNRCDDTRKDISTLSLSLPIKNILDRKEKYLPDDKLTLLCQCSFSTGVKYQKIEKVLQDIPSSVLNQINNNIVTETLSDCCSVIDDLKNLYSTQLLTDVELKTKTKSYRAHKNLLCVRSPVFKTMFSNDMIEKNTDLIEVKDLDSDTVEKLLHFLYSDNITNPNWDSVIDLYYAAVKYSIEKLKLMCSTFLLDSLDPSNVAEILFFADMVNDSDLQRCVNDFIQNHEKQVYGSDKWLELAERKPALVCKTMLLKYRQDI